MSILNRLGSRVEVKVRVRRAEPVEQARKSVASFRPIQSHGRTLSDAVREDREGRF